MMDILSVTDLVWQDAARTAVFMTVEIATVGKVPFSATAADGEAHGRSLYARAVAGEFGPIAAHQAPLVTLADAQRSAVARINAAFETAAAALTAGYPKTETLTWPDQQREAMAWQADNAAPTPYLDALALARGIDRATYIAKTVAKIALFKAGSAALVGKRQKLADQIQAATDATAADAIQW